MEHTASLCLCYVLLPPGILIVALLPGWVSCSVFAPPARHPTPTSSADSLSQFPWARALPRDRVLDRNSWEPGSIQPPGEQRPLPSGRVFKVARRCVGKGVENCWQEGLAHKAPGDGGLQKGLVCGTTPGAESLFFPS